MSLEEPVVLFTSRTRSGARKDAKAEALAAAKAQAKVAKEHTVVASPDNEEDESEQVPKRKPKRRQKSGKSNPGPKQKRLKKTAPAQEEVVANPDNMESEEEEEESEQVPEPKPKPKRKQRKSRKSVKKTAPVQNEVAAQLEEEDEDEEEKELSFIESLSGEKSASRKPQMWIKAFRKIVNKTMPSDKHYRSNQHEFEKAFAQLACLAVCCGGFLPGEGKHEKDILEKFRPQDLVRYKDMADKLSKVKPVEPYERPIGNWVANQQQLLKMDAWNTLEDLAPRMQRGEDGKAPVKPLWYNHYEALDDVGFPRIKGNN